MLGSWAFFLMRCFQARALGVLLFKVKGVRFLRPLP